MTPIHEEIQKKAFKKWSAQGRPEEQDWAVVNFLTGAGKDICKDSYEAAVKETEKAFGGCKYCYGKSYSTNFYGTEGFDDFGGEGFKIEPTEHIDFCSCERGKELEKRFKAQYEEGMQKEAINCHEHVQEAMKESRETALDEAIEAVKGLPYKEECKVLKDRVLKLLASLKHKKVGEEALKQ